MSLTTRQPRFRTHLGLIVCGALVLRVLYTVLSSRHLGGFGDYQYFHGVANLIADGDGFTNPFLAARGEHQATALHPPLWPLVLSGPSALGATGTLAHKLVGSLIGAGSVAVIGLLGRRVRGEAVGLTAAGIAAVYPLFIGADGSLMSETLYGLLVGLGLLLALRLIDRPSAAVAAGLGVTIGLAALTRTEGLAYLALLVLPAVWPAGSLRRRALLAAVACAAALAVITPWTARNVSAFDRLVPISTNEATVLAGANCGQVYGGSEIGSWRLDCVSPSRFPNEGKQAEKWRREGLEYMSDHRGRLPKVVTARILRTWGMFPPGKVVVNEGRARWIAQLETIAYLLLLPLALAGAWFLRGRRAELLVLLAPVVTVTLVSGYGWGLTRFRHPADVALVVLAAVALVEVTRRASARRRLTSSGP